MAVIVRIKLQVSLEDVKQREKACIYFKSQSCHQLGVPENDLYIQNVEKRHEMSTGGL